MANRTSKQLLTPEELTIQKLKETFNHNGNILTDPNGTNVWLMAVSAITFTDCPFDPPLPVPDNHPPTHQVRIVLRTTDSQSGTNPYVDGSDFFFHVDEPNQNAEFVWEDESFAESPHFHGGDIPSAITWVKSLTEPLLYLCLKDPFLTAEQLISLNGHEEADLLTEPV
ncbi:hypothetical protein [Paenibacillus sp. N3.4]|uniref:hypothetical protein n=1 Tax=Paenibacillus sp. N3.4 TaxID=2603222 RepID=UPI0011C7490C|nr:hypothetical protein [Paenibacillus sp. N3.4]TXK75426.1 hypothetical protein FU659_27455 [Paenibacillus sp. N3.4]